MHFQAVVHCVKSKTFILYSGFISLCFENGWTFTSISILKRNILLTISFLTVQGRVLLAGHAEAPVQHHPVRGLDVLERLGPQRHLQGGQVQRKECAGRHLNSSCKFFVKVNYCTHLTKLYLAAFN